MKQCFSILNLSLDIYNDIIDYETKYYLLNKTNNLNEIIIFLKSNNNNKLLPFYLKYDYINNIKFICSNIINTIFNPKEEFRYFCYKCYDLIKNKELPNLEFDLKYETVLIEFRELIHLEFLIKNAILKIGNKWSFTIVCGNLNYDYLLKIIDNMNIKVIKLNIDNMDIENYNKLLCSKQFWNLFTGDKILIYQEDTFIFKSNLMDFIEWDYIGAPWVNNKDSLKVGNGGFSLRSKKTMLDIVDNIPNIDYIAEDVYFSKNIDKYGNLSDFISALKFSSEYLCNNNSFGSHCFFFYNYKWKSIIYNNLINYFL
jgi:hypothetical protein